MSNNVMTVAALRKFAAGTKPLTDAQYASGTDTIAHSAVVGRFTLMLVAYGVSERCIAGTDASGSMTRLAADTKPTPDHSDKGWRSTVSKHAGAWRYAVDAGVPDLIDPATADLLFRAYDSTAAGRQTMAAAVKSAAGMAADAALQTLVSAAREAVESKALNRKPEASKAAQTDADASATGGKAAPDDGSKAAPTRVELTPAEMLTLVTAAPDGWTSTLDSDTLRFLQGRAAVLVDSIDTALANLDALVGTHRNRRTGK